MPNLLLLVPPPPRFLHLPPFLNIDMGEIKNNNKNQKNCFRKCRQNQELLNPCSRQSSGYLIRELWYFQNLPKRQRNFIQDFSIIINFIQDFSIISNGLTYSICSLTWSFLEPWQKSLKKLVAFLIYLKTPKFPFKINWTSGMLLLL